MDYAHEGGFRMSWPKCVNNKSNAINAIIKKKNKSNDLLLGFA